MFQKLNLLIVSLCLLLLISCDSDDDDNPSDQNGDGKPPAEMVDTWVFQSVKVNTVPDNLASVMNWEQDAVQARLHIYENSAYVYEQVNIAGGQLFAENGFVFVDGNEIDVNVQFDSDGNPVNETVYLTYILEADTLHLQEIDEGDVIDYRLLRNN